MDRTDTASPNEALRAKARDLPELPGVYLFKSASGTVLYVGKSVSLRHRVASYFQTGRLNPRIQRMVDRAVDLEFFVTNNEEEALLLEYEFINKHRPRFNIVFRDDKSYPYVKVTDEEFPRIYFTRKPSEGKGRVLGPYPSADSLRLTLRFMHSLFPVRSCRIPSARLSRVRACLEYHIRRCGAPCEGRIDAEGYRRVVEQAVLFLRGRDEELTAQLRRQMKQAGESWDLERAAELKQQLTALEKIFTRQRVSVASSEDLDVIAAVGAEACPSDGPEAAAQSRPDEPDPCSLGPRRWVVQQLVVRNGRIQGQKKMVLNKAAAGAPEVVAEFVKQQYLGAELVPAELLVPEEIPDRELIARVLSQRAGRRVEITVPQRGRKHGLVQLAVRNAGLYLESEASAGARAGEALAELARVLGLERPPVRVDCFDISHTGGSETVASLVTAAAGVLDRSGYRRYRIRTVGGVDDFASMREVVERRYGRLLAEGQQLPDLVLIDGGKGQLGAAKEALIGLGLGSLPVASLAKREETLFATAIPDGVKLPEESPARLFVQRVRDEAHRFAIRYHRSLRSARQTGSALDEIPGIGPMSRARLLRHFRSLARIKAASLAELEEVRGLPARVARAVFDHFHQA